MVNAMARTNPLDDARRPCPACGQPIHTVAGRCKHCRTDLVKLREQRARVQKVDPSVLAAAAAATTQPAPSPFAPPTNGAAAAPPAMMPALEAVPPPNGHDLNAPPAYATYPDAAPPRSAWSRRWPTLVVVLAGIAIAVCAYLLLVDGESQAAGSTKRRGVSPAPDRMETMPTPQPTPHAAPTPHTPPPTTTPDPAPPTTPDPTDPWATPPNPAPTPPSAPRTAVPSSDEFYPTMMRALCDKLKACGGLAGGASADDLCEMMLDPQAIDLLQQQSAGGQCRYDEQKAMACLRSIDSISCQGGDLTGILGGFSGLVDCSRALDCS